MDELMKFATLEAAVQHSLKLVATAAVGVALGTLVLNVLGKKGLDGDGGDFNLVGAIVASMTKPCEVRQVHSGQLK